MKDSMSLLNSFQFSSIEELKEWIVKLARPASEVLFDDVELRNLLKISRRTSLEYRRKKIFPFYKIENKIFYVLSEVIEGIKRNGSM